MTNVTDVELLVKRISPCGQRFSKSVSGAGVSDDNREPEQASNGFFGTFENLLSFGELR